MRKAVGKRFFIYCSLIILFVLGIASVLKGFFMVSGTGRIPAGEIRLINDSLIESRGKEEDGKYIEYTYQITENGGASQMLCLESYWSSFRVLLDGEEIYAEEDPYKEQGVRKHWIQLPQESGGKVLTIRFYSEEGLVEQTVRAPIYLGEKYAIIYSFLCTEGYALVFFCFALMLGIVILIWEVLLNRKVRETRFRGFLYLGLFILDAGVWVLTDSAILQLFMGRTGVLTLVSFLSFSQLPCFLLLFLREIITRGKKALEILCGLSLLIEGLIMFVYLFRLLPIYRLLSLTHILIIITLFVVLRMVRIEAKKEHNTEAQGVLLGLKCLAVFVFLAMFSFWVNPASGYAIFYSIGIFLFTGCLAYSYFGVVYRQVEKNARIAVYKRMAYMDSMTGLGNRAAFEQELKKEKASEKLTCILFDSNNLKEINDNYGHQEGDQVIIEIAECLRRVFGSSGGCFRIGGDEFVVLLKDRSETEVRKKLAELEELICEKNRDRRVPFGIASGYAMGQGRDVDLSELFGEADKKMYENKKQMKAGTAGGRLYSTLPK